MDFVAILAQILIAFLQAFYLVMSDSLARCESICNENMKMSLLQLKLSSVGLRSGFELSFIEAVFDLV